MDQENNNTLKAGGLPFSIDRHALLLIIPILVFGLLVSYTWSYTLDDSFIFLHYAQNLGSGHGLVWNIGEILPTEGYTSILWVLILSFFAFLQADLVTVAKIIGIILVLLTAWLGFSELIKRQHRFSAIAFVFLFLCSPYTALNAISGMDTALAIFLVTSFILIMSRFVDAPTPRKAALCGIVALALCLSRPEAVILVIFTMFLVGVLFPSSRKTLFVYGFLPFVILGAAYFAWRYAYFGMLFPLPFYIKQANVGLFAGLSDVRAYLFFVLPILILAFFGIKWRSAKTLALAGGVLALMIYYVFPRHLMGMHFRYLFPLYPAIVLAASLGIENLFRKRALGISLAVTAVLLAFVGQQVVGGRSEVITALAYSTNLERSYVQLGKDLATRGSAHWIALGSVGAVPYYSGWQVLDTFGLNNPVIAGMTDPGQRVAYIWSLKPDLLVLVSTDAANMKALHNYDQLLYQTADSQGYTHGCTFKFNDNYYLWLYARAGTQLSNFACVQT